MGVRAETSFEVGLVGGAIGSVEDFGWGYFIPNKYDSDDLIRIDSLTLSHPKHRGQKDELYNNHIHVGSECCDCDSLTYPNIGYHC